MPPASYKEEDRLFLTAFIISLRSRLYLTQTLRKPFETLTLKD
jgi:hypothetical protein